MEEVKPPVPYDGPMEPLMSPHEDPELSSDSAFHPDNIGPVTLIQLSRLYDVGMAFLAVLDEDKAVALANLHALGEFATPPPAFNPGQEEE